LHVVVSNNAGCLVTSRPAVLTVNTNPPAVFINEWLALNGGALTNPANGQFSPWLELYNAESEAVDLSYYLLVLNGTVWRMPFGSAIGSLSRRLIWLDGGLPDPNGPNALDLHASLPPFSMVLSNSVALRNPTFNPRVDQVDFGPRQATNISQGRFPDGSNGVRFMGPTPRTPNTSPILHPVLTSLPTGGYVLVSNSTTLLVSALGIGPLSYQWSFHGTNLPGATASNLVVTNFQAPQVGPYAVAVSDSLGVTNSSPVTLLLGTRPVITQQPVSLTALEGGTATFSISATGTPPPGLRWRRVGSAITNGVIIDGLNYSALTLTNVRPTDAATYNVVVSNVVTFPPSGFLSSGAVLTVLADTDHDGLPDAWEIAHPGFNLNNPADGARDDDDDGMSNAAEYFAGTDYLNKTSYLAVEIVPGPGATLEFTAVANRTYTIQFTDGLNPILWRKLVDVLAQTNTRTEQRTDPSGGTNRFYRLVTPMQP
jgi:hypothetical protein